MEKLAKIDWEKQLATGASRVAELLNEMSDGVTKLIDRSMQSSGDAAVVQMTTCHWHALPDWPARSSDYSLEVRVVCTSNNNHYDIIKYL